jgi:hypothetical protein
VRNIPLSWPCRSNGGEAEMRDVTELEVGLNESLGYVTNGTLRLVHSEVDLLKAVLGDELE